MFFNRGFVVSVRCVSRSKIHSSKSSVSYQQLNSTKNNVSIFINWWWTLIIWVFVVLVGMICEIIGIYLRKTTSRRKAEEGFFNLVLSKIKQPLFMLKIIAICLGCGLFPSGCHFFWRRSMLKKNFKHAKIWLIAFWVLVGIYIAVVVGCWVECGSKKEIK